MQTRQDSRARSEIGEHAWLFEDVCSEPGVAVFKSL